MLSRRDLITSGGALTQLRPADAAAQQSQSCPDNGAELNGIRDALREIRHSAASPAVHQVRNRQRVFLKQYERFPDVIDVGIAIWEGMQDWHVENRQEMKISRSPEGRYMMEFMLTRLVLRPDFSDDQVGVAYDQ